MKVSAREWALIDGLPGEDLVAKGLRELAAGRRESCWALFLLQARTRLIQDGLHCLAELAGPFQDDAHIKFYRSLESESEEDTYPRYNSFNRQLCSFSASLAARSRRQRAS